MREFDVVVVGAGPAGGYCARKLSSKGYSVLLVEQNESFEQNNFSSAATPLETLAKFDLPPEVVATPWRKLEIITSKISRSWHSSEALGVVFDFAKLRAFLAQQVKEQGGEVYLGYRCYQSQGNIVFLRAKKGEITQIKAKVIVDATGYSRSVLYPNKNKRPTFSKAIGIEYLIQVPSQIYEPYAENLVFFLGHHWSPKGYGWIFPMNNFQLKVGVAQIDEPHHIVEKTESLRYYIDQIIRDHIGTIDYHLLETHGSIIEYSLGLRDCYYRDNIIAIGDAVSTVNYLGGEGIRHAMDGAQIASLAIERYLAGQITNFADYQKQMLNIYRSSWGKSEQLSRKVYLQYSDARIDQGVNSLKYLSTQEILDILFNYRFEQYLKGIKGYLWKKITRLFASFSAK